ncbi:MAG: hypothetical protein L2C94_000800 [Aigarchaeota archaeon]|nr:hypothetical protein [Candidatus Wolframiiraptor gerlachensis]
MTYRVQFFIADDELSKKMLKVIDQVTKLLTERFGPRMTSSSKDFIAYVLTNNTVSLSLEQGASDTIQLDIYFVLETYREELKARFKVADFPAAILDDRTYIAEKALEIASKLYSLLKTSRGINDDELLAGLKKLSIQEPVAESKIVAERSLRSALSILQKGVEPAIRVASKVASGIIRTAQLSTSSPLGGTEVEVAVSARPKSEPAPKGSPTDGILFERNVIRAGISECLAKLERLREEGKIDENAYRKMKAVYDAFLS